MKPSTLPLLTALLTALLTITTTTTAITLTKRTDSRVLHLNLQRNTIPNPVAHDTQRREYLRRLKTRDGVVSADLANQVTLYALNITLGTPPQPFTVNVDTGSSDLWVNTASSSLCRERSQPCEGIGTYSANDSSSYSYVNSDFNITYAGGNSAGGDYVTDTMRFAGQTVNDLQFGVGYDSSTPLAILGLGYPLNEAQSSNAGLRPYKNLPAKMAADNIIASNAYSVWLNDLNADQGNLLFGGVDRAQYEGDLVTVPIQASQGVFAEFLVSLTDVQLDGQSVPQVSNSNSNSAMALAVLLDTGTSLTYLPNDMTATIYEAVNAQLDERQGVGIVPCSLARQNANMTFRFSDSVSIDVPLRELVFSEISSSGFGSSGGDGSSACQFGIAPAGQGETIILGDTFLRSAYVVFDLDNNEISLAQSRINATDTDIAEIGSGAGAVPSAATATSVVSATGLPAAPTATETDTDGAGAVMSPSMVGVGVSVVVVMFVGGFL